MGRAGPATGLRLATGGISFLWTVYAQTLFGDPEMPVWTDVPALQEVTHPASIAWGGNITVTVRKLGTPVAGHRVTLMGGWSSSAQRPPVLMIKTTNSFGQASFALPSSGTRVGQLRVTVTRWELQAVPGHRDCDRWMTVATRAEPKTSNPIRPPVPWLSQE